MSNLLLGEGEKAITREYRVRVLTLWAFLCAGAFVVVAVLLIPVFVFTAIHTKALSVKGVSPEAEGNAAKYTEVQKELESANQIAEKLVPKKEILASVLLSDISARRTSGITITAFHFARTDKLVVSLGGVAAARATLVAFVDALKESPHFTDATIPVGGLAKDSDIPFEITLAVRQ